MSVRYFTLCVYDPACGEWFDEWGFTTLAEAKAEKAAYRDNGTPSRYLAIIESDGSALDMMTRRDALPRPAK